MRLHSDDERIVACSVPLAHVAALMKTRYRNWPSETDAEIRVFVLGFAIRRPGPHAAKAACSRAFHAEPKSRAKTETCWLGRQDSNLGMAETNPPILPFISAIILKLPAKSGPFAINKLDTD